MGSRTGRGGKKVKHIIISQQIQHCHEQNVKIKKRTKETEKEKTARIDEEIRKGLNSLTPEEGEELVRMFTEMSEKRKKRKAR